MLGLQLEKSKKGGANPQKFWKLACVILHRVQNCIEQLLLGQSTMLC